MTRNEIRIERLTRRRIELKYQIAQWDGFWMRMTTFSKTASDYHALQAGPARIELRAVEKELADLGASSWTMMDVFVLSAIFAFVVWVIAMIILGISNLS